MKCRHHDTNINNHDCCTSSVVLWDVQQLLTMMLIVVVVMIVVIVRVMEALILQSWNKFYSRSDHFGRSHKAGLIGIIIAPSTPPPFSPSPSLSSPFCSLIDTYMHTHRICQPTNAQTHTRLYTNTYSHTRSHNTLTQTQHTHTDTLFITQAIQVKYNK